MKAHPDVAEFQRTHADHLGRHLKPDGVVGPLTRWAMAVDALPLERRRTVLNAVSHLGRMETPPGSNRSATIDRWLLDCGVAPGQPWCAAFASACLQLPMGIASAVRLGQRYDATDKPQAGDLMWYPTDDRGHGHVGIVIGVGDAEVMTIEGNVDSSVRCLRRERGKVRFSRTSNAGVEQARPGVDGALQLRPANVAGTR